MIWYIPSARMRSRAWSHKNISFRAALILFLFSLRALCLRTEPSRRPSPLLAGLRRSEVRAEPYCRAMSLSERTGRHMLILLLRAATCPPIFPTGPKNRDSFLSPALSRLVFAKGSMMRFAVRLRRSSDRSGSACPPVATSPRTHDPPHLRSRSASRFRPISTQPVHIL